VTARDDDTARKPWWYSGEDDADPLEPETAAPELALEESQEVPTEDASGSTPPGMDWSMLMMGAAKMVDWATERVMAPHAEHGNPADHPQCVVCRTIVLVGDPEGLGVRAERPPAPGEGSDDVAHDDDHRDAGAIRWIPILGTPTDPQGERPPLG